MKNTTRRKMKQLRHVRRCCIATMILTFVIMVSYAFGMHITEAANVSEEVVTIEPFPGAEVVEETMKKAEDVRHITIVIEEPAEEEIEDTETEDNIVMLFPEESLDIEIQEHMYMMCQQYDIPMEILMGLAFKESTYNPNAIGKDGKDHGLCQIRTNNHKWIEEYLGRDMDFFDPYDSVEAVCVMLSDIRSRNENKSWEYILLCYNRGEGGAKKFINKYGSSSSSYTRAVLSKAVELGYSL